jgi:hypothetical protein
MSCLGVHFALTEEAVSKLKEFDSDDKRLECVQEEIEEKYFSELPELKAESDKAWDAMHRLLSDEELSYTSGPDPLRLVVLGGDALYFKDDYIMSLKTPDQVKSVATAIDSFPKEKFKRLYSSMDERKYGFPKSKDDFEYTWELFLAVSSLYKKAAIENRYVLFTADQ